VLDFEKNDLIVLKKCGATGVGWLPDGKRFVAGSTDGHLFLWDVATWKVIEKRKCKNVWSLAVSPDGRQLAVGDDDYAIQLYSLPGLELVGSCAHHKHLIHGLAFDAEGRRLLSASRDDTVALWDVETRTLVRVLRGHTNCVYSARFTSARHAVSGGLDGRLLRWDLDNGTSSELDKQKSIHSVAVTGSVVVSGGEDGVRFYALAD
jgi:WD40 repeat protein